MSAILNFPFNQIKTRTAQAEFAGFQVVCVIGLFLYHVWRSLWNMFVEPLTGINRFQCLPVRYTVVLPCAGVGDGPVLVVCSAVCVLGFHSAVSLRLLPCVCFVRLCLNMNPFAKSKSSSVRGMFVI